MTRFFFMMVLFAVLACGASAAALAELKYYPDPVYEKLNDDDTHPMDEMQDLAKQGDARAQFILGDLYSKGKGGLPRNPAESRRWFEEAAMHGYAHSFIRLAALAKHNKKPIEAWQWYTLAMDAFDSGAERDYAVSARHELIVDAGLKQDDILLAIKSRKNWEAARDKRLREEREQAADAAKDKVASSKQEKPSTGEKR